MHVALAGMGVQPEAGHGVVRMCDGDERVLVLRLGDHPEDHTKNDGENHRGQQQRVACQGFAHALRQPLSKLHRTLGHSRRRCAHPGHPYNGAGMDHTQGHALHSSHEQRDPDPGARPRRWPKDLRALLAAGIIALLALTAHGALDALLTPSSR